MILFVGKRRNPRKQHVKVVLLCTALQLLHLFPEADVPVVQLSLDLRRPGPQHFAIGRMLAPLRDGRLASARRPWPGTIVVDGNLTSAQLTAIATDPALARADLSILDHPAQITLMKKIAEWPRTVEIAARAHEPHRIAFFLYELASDLHALWNRGNDEPALRFVSDGDPSATAAKIALARAVGVVISAGLGILGVTPAVEMR